MILTVNADCHVIQKKKSKILTGCGICHGLCQTNTFYYIWRTSFVGQSISATLQNIIKRLLSNTFDLFIR